MKHLQLSPPLLILTMGYPGAGKSFFARQFADQYGLARISEDRIRYELFERPQFTTEEAEIIGRAFQYMLEQLMQTERTIICDGSFLEAAERRNLYQLASQHGYRSLTIWLQTDTETSAQRAANRDRRNPDSKYTFPLERAEFMRLKEKLERPTDKEVALVVSGKHAFKSQCLTVLRKIAAIYSESVSRGDFTVKPTPEVPPRRTVRPSRRFIQ